MEQKRTPRATTARSSGSHTANPLEIIQANPGDAPTLGAIAWASKAHWGYPSHWMERWREQLTISPEFIATNETFVAIINQRIVAFHALVETAETVRLDHLWVRPEQIGQGIGRSLFRHAVGRAAARRAPSLTIEADPHAEPFYLRMGAVRTGTITSEIDGQRRELPILTFDLTQNKAHLP